MDTEQVSLAGRHVRLDPLTAGDADGLRDAATDGELWNLWFTTVPRPENMAAFVARRLDEASAGTWVPFVVRRLPDERIVGLTNYLHLDQPNRRLEIGGTWYAASAQRTAVNTEAKLLLLTRAFETLGCYAVEFRTHLANTRSQAAIERLGAHRDGVLRRHQIMPDGHVRDTVVYSILDSEWPAIRERLQARLAAADAEPPESGAG